MKGTNDDKPPPCPACNASLEPMGEAESGESTYTVHYVCARCATYWRYEGWGSDLIRIGGPEDCE